MDLVEIIIKKLDNKVSVAEDKLFMDWYEASHENRAVFKRLKLAKTKRGNIPDVSAIDSRMALNKLILRYKSRRKKKAFVSVMKYASIFIVLLISSYSIWYFSNINGKNKLTHSNSITLDIGNGEIKMLSVDGSEDIMNKSGKFLGKIHNSEIDYTTTNIDKLTYHSINVPNGKVFNVRLSDGTLVHLNAGSSLQYPAKFASNGMRKVTLSGEAFFEVSKDNMRPFVVNSESLDITVLGTKFNVSSYPENRNINTVLVEGSVKLASIGKEAQFLEPGHMASWNPTNGKLSFSKVDTAIYTMWMQGKLVIHQLSFDEIITKLERYYGVTIENRNEKIKNQVYTVEFKDENIDQVLKFFQIDTPFNYSINDSKITIY